MTIDEIDYSALIDEAMHVIVKKALLLVQQYGLPGGHHFFVSFITRYPGVSLSEKLRKRYPDEITIVLQYQFDDLLVDDDHFEVTLSFDGIKERIVVPFVALTAFADPSVKFGLQFRHMHDDLFEDTDDTEEEEEARLQRDVTPSPPKNSAKEKAKPAKKPAASRQKGAHDNVIALDAFRNNRPPTSS
jgi:hypothetical protein